MRRTPAALKIERLEEQVRKLKAEREQPETEAIAALKRQLEARNTRIANLQGLVRALQADLADIRSHKGHPITKALHREIRACLHPDRVAPELQERYQRAFQQFNEVRFKFEDGSHWPDRTW